MELPTYTNIWKIEKRLYKLYDFRLPMPLPVGQVAVFVAIAVPYMLILTMAGMPFSHTWVWLYVLPPGVLAWLVTRPVLEGKRLPELVLSQLRYLSEPRTWCRMAPLAEKDEITLMARVWRRSAAVVGAQAVAAPAVGVQRVGAQGAGAQAAGAEHAGAELADLEAVETWPVETWPVEAEPVEAEPVETEPVQAESGETEPGEAAEIAAFTAGDAIDVSARPVWPSSPAIHAPAVSTPAVSAPAVSEPAVNMPRVSGPDVAAAPGVTEPGTSPEVPVRVAAAASAQEVTERPAPERLAPEWPAPERSAPERSAPDRSAPNVPRQPAARPGLTVRTDGRSAQPLHLVERALRSAPGGGPAGGRHDRVVVVPGGHRPGRPDQVQREQARARLPLVGPARIVVLGCTTGAGQTVTTLLTGQLLASLRGEAVAVLDLSDGPGSLTEQARQIPRLLPGRRNAAWSAPGSKDPGPRRERGLQVVTAAGDADEPADAGQIIDAVVARYPLMLADPAAAQVPRAVNAADQLVLVAPANPDAAGALAMTLEWLDGHGLSELARRAVAVLNGVSANSAAHTDKAAAVATGRCRAIVRVPWDGGMSGQGPLGPATVQAYTALAGVLVSGLADASASAAGQSGIAQQGRDSQ